MPVERLIYLDYVAAGARLLQPVRLLSLTFPADGRRWLHELFRCVDKDRMTASMIQFNFGRTGELSPGLVTEGLLRLASGVPATTRQRLAEIETTTSELDSAFEHDGCVEHQMDSAKRVYAALSEMRADRCALAY